MNCKHCNLGKILYTAEYNIPTQAVQPPLLENDSPLSVPTQHSLALLAETILPVQLLLL